MAKQNFSSSVDASLNGRGSTDTNNAASTTTTVPAAVPVEQPKVVKAKSNAGRKPKKAAEKKKQMVLTLSPETYNKLLEWAESKPRTAPNYVSEFVGEHINEITK